MGYSFATCASLLLLFAAASCAPPGYRLQDACANVRGRSLELNRVARNAFEGAKKASKDAANFSTALAWIEAKDMCDPGSLKHKPGPCIGKIFNVLKSYSSAVGKIAQFQNCSNFTSEVKPVIEKLQKDMDVCVKSKGEETNEREPSISEEQPMFRWQEPLLCRYTLDRLFSFSILTARVFAVGDPAHHAEGPVQKCM